MCYDGDLTTPSCTESVHWSVATLPIEISIHQYDELNTLIFANEQIDPTTCLITAPPKLPLRLPSNDPNTTAEDRPPIQFVCPGDTLFPDDEHNVSEMKIIKEDTALTGLYVGLVMVWLLFFLGLYTYCRNRHRWESSRSSIFSTSASTLIKPNSQQGGSLSDSRNFAAMNKQQLGKSINLLKKYFRRSQLSHRETRFMRSGKNESSTGSRSADFMRGFSDRSFSSVGLDEDNLPNIDDVGEEAFKEAAAVLYAKAKFSDTI